MMMGSSPICGGGRSESKAGFNQGWVIKGEYELPADEGCIYQQAQEKELPSADSNQREDGGFHFRCLNLFANLPVNISVVCEWWQAHFLLFPFAKHEIWKQLVYMWLPTSRESFCFKALKYWKVVVCVDHLSDVFCDLIPLLSPLFIDSNKKGLICIFNVSATFLKAGCMKRKSRRSTVCCITSQNPQIKIFYLS